MNRDSYTFHGISLGNVSVFLLYRPGEAILVDSGNAGSEVKILEKITSLGLQPGNLRLLILTHAHFDHAGSAARIRELTGCRVVAHRLEAERLRAGFTGLPPGTRWKAKLLVGIGRSLAGRLGKFPPVNPDILVEDEMDLSEYGFPGRIMHTPGHTVGSMVVLMGNGELIAGDSVFGLVNKQHFPPFAEDLPALVGSWKKIRELGAVTIYPSHGRIVSWESFTDEFDGAVKRYGRAEQGI
jgi:glyoxylase-like metal-dependent hydrolase (beta-lactamase superfamily II)